MAYPGLCKSLADGTEVRFRPCSTNMFKLEVEDYLALVGALGYLAILAAIIYEAFIKNLA